MAWTAIQSPLSKLKRRLDSLEATQWTPRDTSRDSRGERTPLLLLEARSDPPCETGMRYASVLSSNETDVSGTFGVASRVAVTFHTSRRNMGLLLRRCSGQGASSCEEVGNTWIISSCGEILELRRGFQASSCVGPGRPNLPLELRGKAGGCGRVTAGPKRPHLGVCPGPDIPLK